MSEKQRAAAANLLPQGTCGRDDKLEMKHMKFNFQAVCEAEIVLNKLINECLLWQCVGIFSHMLRMIEIPYFSLEAN